MIILTQWKVLVNKLHAFTTSENYWPGINLDDKIHQRTKTQSLNRIAIIIIFKLFTKPLCTYYISLLTTHSLLQNSRQSVNLKSAWLNTWLCFEFQGAGRFFSWSYPLDHVNCCCAFIHKFVSCLWMSENEQEWAKAVQKFSSALQPFNLIQSKVFCSCSTTHDTPFAQIVYLFLACLLAVHPTIQTGTTGTFLHVRSHIILFFTYKIAQISAIKNTHSPRNSLICSDEGVGLETYVTGQNYIRLKFFNLGSFSISFVS